MLLAGKGVATAKANNQIYVMVISHPIFTRLGKSCKIIILTGFRLLGC